MEGGEQGAQGRGAVGAGAREVVGAELGAVLGDEQRGPEEACGQESREGGGASGGGVAEVGRAEGVLLVPVEGEGAQDPFQVLGEGEVVGEPGGGRAPACAGRAAGGFEGADGVVGAERAGQSAALAGEFGELVEPFGEGAREVVGGVAGGVLLRAEARGQPLVRLGEAAAVAAPVGAAGGAGRAERGAFEEVPGGAFGVCRADEPGVGGQRQGGAGGGRAADGVQVEAVLPESAHEPLAPDAGLTDGIRVATLREQCDPHACTPDLP